MFKANERCYNRTFGLYGLETLNHCSELNILWDTFRSQIAELWFPYDRKRSQMIADDRRRSQTIAEDRTWFYLLRSSAITIAGDRRSVFPYDRRRSQKFLRSAIRDRLRSYGNQPEGPLWDNIDRPHATKIEQRLFCGQNMVGAKYIN